MVLIKPGITADGFKTAVRDYTETSVVEELAANSYDADATTVLVLLDGDRGLLSIYDDGIGFTGEAFHGIATLGAGNKRDIPFSQTQRHYLGSYGYGLKSTLNIATKVEIESFSETEHLHATIDWNQLYEALKPDFEGFPCDVTAQVNKFHGTRIKLRLKNPTTKAHLDRFGEALSNLPSDEGRFRCYYALYGDVIGSLPKNPAALFNRLKDIVAKLSAKNIVHVAGTSSLEDLSSCSIVDLTDKQDPTAKARIYFTGFQDDKVKQLKPGLRGIYVRIHNRLLKQSFTDSKFTYNISKWKKFESGVRIEFSIDWLRDQITLSREGIRFSNEKLESDFKSILTRTISAFIQPQLKTLQKKHAKILDKKTKQRIELAKKRVAQSKDIMIPGLSGGFVFSP